jgi:tungstate transport system substrate-binding protein
LVVAIKGTKDIVAAFKALKQKGLIFISLGDRSGTHQAELKFWKEAGIDIAPSRGAEL